MWVDLISQLAHKVSAYLIKINLSARGKKLIDLAAANSNSSASNTAKITTLKNIAKNVVCVVKNRFHNLKINKFTMNYEF